MKETPFNLALKALQHAWLWLLLFLLALIVTVIVGLIALYSSGFLFSAQIFSLHANSPLGKLQVLLWGLTGPVLAVLTYKLSRGIIPLLLMIGYGVVCGIGIALSQDTEGLIANGMMVYALELLVLCWACAIGRLAKDVRQGLAALIYPAAILLIAVFSRMATG